MCIFGIYYNSLRIFVSNGVRVFKLKDKRTGKSVFESDVEIGNVIFEDIWYFFRIGDDALNLRLPIYEGNLANDRRKSIFKHCDDFLLRLFIIFN